MRGAEALGRALQGDLVAVELLPVREWGGMGIEREEMDEEVEGSPPSEVLEALERGLVPQGRVVAVLRRDPRLFVAEFERTIGNFAILRPATSQLPSLIIRRPQGSIAGKKLVASIDSWPSGSLYPLGKMVKILGDCESTGVENDAILFEFGVETRPFSSAVLNCLPPAGESWTPGPADLKGRLDLRDRLVMSVDPPGCKDIDDALHCVEIAGGGVALGEHIADVTHFVRPDTPLDLEASRRGTTVYLVDRRTDMLPKLLTETLCSLTTFGDKLAFSAIFTFDAKTLEVVDVKFAKTLIRSRASLSYRAAQDLIDGVSSSTSGAAAAPPGAAESLRALLKVSRALKARRVEAGALSLASTQLRFALDAEMNPSDVAPYELLETNSMVEEFMLLANIAVARKIASSFPSTAVLRRHSRPKPDAIRQLARILGHLGYDLDFSSNLSLAESLNQIQRPDDAYFNRLVRILTTRCMNEAVYFCAGDVDLSEQGHFGLAAELYTHFTSPIRRYADVLVHRLLAAAAGVESLPDIMCHRQQLAAICDNLNIKNRNARNASRASSDYFCYLFFKDKTLGERAMVSGIHSSGFSVLVQKFGFEGNVEFSKQDLEDNAKIAKEGNDRQLVSFKHNGVLRNLFDWLDVKVSVKLLNFRKQVVIEVL